MGQLLGNAALSSWVSCPAYSVHTEPCGPLASCEGSKACRPLPVRTPVPRICHRLRPGQQAQYRCREWLLGHCQSQQPVGTAGAPSHDAPAADQGARDTRGWGQVLGQTLNLSPTSGCVAWLVSACWWRQDGAFPGGFLSASLVTRWGQPRPLVSP